VTDASAAMAPPAGPAAPPAGPAAPPRPAAAPRRPATRFRNAVLIRLFTGLFAFAIAVCALIIIKPFADARMQTAAPVALVGAATLPGTDAAARTVADPGAGGGAQVTRASDPLSLTPDEADVIAAAMIAYRESLPQADEMAASPAPEIVPITARAATPSTFGIGGGVPVAERGIVTDQTSLGDTTAAVLAGLGLQAGAEPTGADPLRDMTASALSGIRTVTGDTTAPATPRTALQVLVVQALQEGQSDAYIDALLNDAAAAGRISVPQVLVTADGRVDTAVLLSSLVAQARVAQGGAAAVVPQNVGGDGVEVRVVQTATQTESYRFYTVGAGDSLGAISVKFYGSVEYFGLIFDANRDLLSSPDQIMVGQRLVVPDLPDA